MQEELIEENEAPRDVRLCKRPGCTKAAWPGKAYCSRECAPHAHLLERNEQFPRAAPALQAMPFEDRQCENHCGKGFRVLASSEQRYCSHLCQTLAGGSDPFKDQDWHGKPAPAEPPKREQTSEETDDMAARGKTVERPDTSALTGAQLAVELGVTSQTIYNWVKAGKIRPGRNGFDLDDVKRALEKNPPGKRGGRHPRAAPAPKAAPASKEREITREPVDATPLRAVPEPPPFDTATLAEIRRRAFDAAIAKFKAVLLEESDRLEAVGDLRTQNALLKDCIRAETRFQRCFDPEAA